ncbi:hypothetical protein [Paenibacillus elgii]|uniref:hypothetical protein n=1 Tax=Paenibacillus elgii TaxID=189691 RepID=UPI00203BF9D3|nr:hypothetical protein [Paenibacillus elgii]MCM3274135.1 hypothetical protein [Paenibacillus elgii]
MTMKRKILLILALSLLALLSFLFLNKKNYFVSQQETDYHDVFVGLLPKDQGSELALFDPHKNQFTKIKSLPHVSPDNYANITKDGATIAYTTWDETGTKRYLVVEDVKSEKKDEYLKDREGKYEVVSPSWFLDKKRILMLRNDVSNSSADQDIIILDVDSGKTMTLAKGGYWVLVKFDEQDRKQFAMSQDELDQLIEKYGGDRKIPLEEAGSKVFVKFSKPSLSRDNKRVTYSASLYRNAAKQGEGLVIASSLWVVDLDTGKNKKIYSTKNKAMLGKATWGYDGASIAFVEYKDMTGENGKILTLDYTKPDSSLRTIIETTDQTYTNLDPFYIQEKEITFLSIPEGKSEKEATRFIQKMDNETREILDVQLEGQKQLLRNFTFIQ